MTSLYIIFGLAMFVDAVVAYLCVEIALSEFKGINLPFMKLLKGNKEAYIGEKRMTKKDKEDVISVCNMLADKMSDDGQVAVQQVIEAVKDMKEAEWVPVKERLPEDNCRCWVTTRIGTLGSCDFAKDLYKIDEYTFENKQGKAGFYAYDSEYGYWEWHDIKAWMPYYEPEPYKEAGTEVE